jgi:hypothetical protein
LEDFNFYPSVSHNNGWVWRRMGVYVQKNPVGISVLLDYLPCMLTTEKTCCGLAFGGAAKPGVKGPQTPATGAFRADCERHS